MNTCANGSCCWVTCTIIATLWLLVGSGLLFLTWNKVIVSFTKLNKAKYWQALLLVVTVMFLSLPRYYMQRSMMHRGACFSHKCDKKDECPYSRGEQREEAEHVAKPAAK